MKSTPVCLFGHGSSLGNECCKWVAYRLHFFPENFSFLTRFYLSTRRFGQGNQFTILLIPVSKMSQGYAVELYFDPALENQVLKAWNVLARRQISTQLIEIEARPHITLLSSPTLDPLKLQNIIRNFSAKQEPLALTLSSVGSFSTDENVLFLAPTPSLSILTFHGQLYELLKREGIEAGDSYQPDNWVPHCTVAQDVPRNRMAEAFSILRDFKLPISGYILDIGLVEFSPVREHFSFPLGNDIET